MVSPQQPYLPTLLDSISAMEFDLKGLPALIDEEYYRLLGRILDDRLPAVYAAYDGYCFDALKSDAKVPVCRRGCSACCRHFVDSVEPFEIAAVHRRIRDRGDYADLLVGLHQRTALLARLRLEEANHPRAEEIEDRALHRYFLRGVPCPFLAPDGACGIYADRPLSCRMFFSESNPKFCSGSAITSPWNRNFQVELPEEVEKSLFRCAQLLAGLKLPEGLFPGLLAMNERFGRFDAENS